MHFQFPPTKNLRASRDEVEVKDLACLAAVLAALVASLLAVLESMVEMEKAVTILCWLSNNNDDDAFGVGMKREIDWF